LRLEKVWSYEENPAVQYWKRMKPLEHCVVGEGVPVVFSLSEYYRFIEKNTVDKPYLAQIGRVVDAVKPACFHLSTCLRPRTVYVIGQSHKMIPFLKRHTHYASEGDKFYFLFQNDAKLEWKEIDMGVRHFFLDIQEAKETHYKASVIGMDLPQIWVRTLFGLQTFDLSSSLTALLLHDYLSEFGDRASHAYLPQLENVPPPSEFSLKWNGEECSLWKAYNDVLTSDIIRIADPFENPLAWKSVTGQYLIKTRLKDWGAMYGWMEGKKSIKFQKAMEVLKIVPNRKSAANLYPKKNVAKSWHQYPDVVRDHNQAYVLQMEKLRKDHPHLDEAGILAMLAEEREKVD